MKRPTQRGGNPNPRITLSQIFAVVVYFGDVVALSGDEGATDFVVALDKLMAEFCGKAYVGVLVSSTTAHAVLCFRNLNDARAVRDDWQTAMSLLESRKTPPK